MCYRVLPYVSSLTPRDIRQTNEITRGSDGAGVCGLGPDFCGDGCVSTCDYKSECDPGWGAKWSNATECPLKVCCSKYGFCGTTKDFCGDKVVTAPSCGGTSTNARTIGYYEGWNHQRPCGSMFRTASLKMLKLTLTSDDPRGHPAGLLHSHQLRFLTHRSKDIQLDAYGRGHWVAL